jgi:succinate dehydrogenase/fumarate reductase flavoprotein subunit
MLNSAFLNEEAQKFAEYLHQHAQGDVPTQVQVALQRVFNRPPQEEELQRGLSLIKDLQKDFGQSPDEALKNFCLLALNTNEFLYLD